MSLGFDRYLDQETARHFRDWDGDECECCGKPLLDGCYTTYSGSQLCQDCAIGLAIEYIEDEHQGEEHEFELCDVYEDEIDALLEDWS